MMNDIGATRSAPVDNAGPTTPDRGRGRDLPSPSVRTPEEHPPHRRGGGRTPTTWRPPATGTPVENRWTGRGDTPSTGVDKVCVQLWACGPGHTAPCVVTCTNATSTGVEKNFPDPVRRPQPCATRR